MIRKETFYALSTPRGVSATATIRISGPSALAVISNITKKSKEFFKHKKSILLPIYNINNDLIDNVIIVTYLSPRSYTGENMVEVHTHGNPIIIKNLFACLTENGLRLASPGEFTRVAYLNKKIDLVQAEATLNLINAKSKAGIEISLNNLSGSLSQKFIFIRKKLINALATIEYELDMSETDNTAQTKKTVLGLVSSSLKDTKNLIKTYNTSRVLNDGARIVFVGKPNVGKSTLFNTLLKHDRSIVTDLAGTTRDTIESVRTISGFSVTLVDTAGIRKTKNPIELAGVNKSLLEIKSADLIISIFDTLEIDSGFVAPKNKPIISVYNKTDLISGPSLKKLKKNKNVDVCISAKRKHGLRELLELIEKNIESNLHLAEGFYVTSKRQEEVLLDVAKTLNVLSDLQLFDLEIFAIEVKEAINRFNWLLGETTPDDILNEVFSRFCVGK